MSFQCRKTRQGRKVLYRNCNKNSPLWWRSVCSPTSVALVILVLGLYLVGSCEFFHHWRWFGDREGKTELSYEASRVYFQAFRAFVTVIAYILLASGIQTDTTIKSIQIASEEQIAVESDLLQPEEYSETTRLLQSLYADNCALQQAAVDPTALDVNLRYFIEALIESEMISAINATISDNLQQSSSVVNIWRSWFRSPLFQQGWIADRLYYSETMNRYVEQMLLPGAPRPKSPWYVWIFRNPLIVINILVLLVVVIGTIVWFGWWGPLAYTPLSLSVAMYVEAVEAFFLASVILLLSYEVGRKAREATIVEDQVEVDSQEEFVRAHYPESVRLYKELYPCDERLKKVKVPEDSDENKEILFNAMYCRVLLIDIQFTLILNPEPTAYGLRLWRSWFRSSILREQYAYNRKRCFLEPYTIHIIDTRVLPCLLQECPEE